MHGAVVITKKEYRKFKRTHTRTSKEMLQIKQKNTKHEWYYIATHTQNTKAIILYQCQI